MLEASPPQVALGQFLTADEVTQRLKVGKSTLYRKIRNENFPEPIRMGVRCSRWSEAAVTDWLAKQKENTAA